MATPVDNMAAARADHAKRIFAAVSAAADTDMAELSVYEDVGLITFSPLAAGLLSGKYQGIRCLIRRCCE